MRSNQEIEVNIFHNNELFTFSFPSGSTVGDLRSQIFNQLQILPENQDLEFNHSSISGDQLKLAGLSEKMPILITVEITEERGFQFNNLKQKQKRNVVVSTKLRDPRIVLPGLVLKAKCKKQGCDAYNKEVNINKGFGKFELGRFLHQGLCPLCMTKTGRIYNFGYYQTNISIEAFSDKNEQYKMQDCADDNLFHPSNSQMDIKFGRSVKSPQLPWKTGTQDSQSNINNKNNSKPSQKTTKIKSNSYQIQKNSTHNAKLRQNN